MRPIRYAVNAGAYNVRAIAEGNGCITRMAKDDEGDVVACCLCSDSLHACDQQCSYIGFTSATRVSRLNPTHEQHAANEEREDRYYKGGGLKSTGRDPAPDGTKGELPAKWLDDRAARTDYRGRVYDKPIPASMRATHHKVSQEKRAYDKCVSDMLDEQRAAFQRYLDAVKVVRDNQEYKL